MLKAAMSKLQVPEAHRYSPHGLLRGGPQELKDPGPPWSVVASSGAWHDAAFRGYYAPLARRGDGRSESFRLGHGIGVGSRSRWYDTVLPGWAKPIDRSATAA